MTGRLPLLLPFLILFPAVAVGEPPLSLQRSYEMALQRSESLAVQEQSIRIAEAHYLQALGTTLPQIDLKATETLQDTGSGGEGSDIGSTFTRRSRPEVALSVRQPLFQGLREFQALKVSNAEKRMTTLERNRARQLLFLDVTQAYYTILELERRREVFRAIRGVFQQRIGELKERLTLGKSRESEVLSAESQAATVTAAIEKTDGGVRTARELLAFLIGEPVTQRLADEFSSSAPGPLQAYLDTVTGRPDLAASGEAVRLARGKLNYEKGARYPTLDVQANYYPYRVGFLSDIDWDVAFSLNFPIFKGGATRGRIREAAAELKQSELTKSEGARRAETDVRQAYHRLIASRKQEAALKSAEAKAAANYKAQVEEYRLGISDNLDVLQGLRDWQERRLEATTAYFQTKLEYLQLLVASGRLPEEAL